MPGGRAERHANQGVESKIAGVDHETAKICVTHRFSIVDIKLVRTFVHQTFQNL